MTLDPGVFARHLDLAPLGQRRRGLVRCIFHADRTASLSVDLDAGVFNCFGCMASGGVKAFAERVGEWQAATTSPVRQRSPRDEALADAHRQLARLAPHLDVYRQADEIRHDHQLVAAVRAVATRLGDTDLSWELLAVAADLERGAQLAEAHLDGELPC